MKLQADGKIITAGYCDMGGATGYDFCLAQYAAGGTLPQYGGANTWGAASASLFGACLSSVAGGASAQWTPSAGCAANDGPAWNAVPTTATKIAYTAGPQPGNATANLRFGLRTASNQAPGDYIAPITFDLVAPNA